MARRRLALSGLVALAGLDGLKWLETARQPGRQDFFGLWSAGRFAHEYPVSGVYDPTKLNLYQHHLAPDFTSFYPFAYPPDMLLLLWPLGALPYHLAWVVWLGSGAALFGAACWGLLRGPARWRGFAVALALLAPASGVNAVLGETGYFTAAALVAGFALLPGRPLWAGVLFGALLLKPQLAVLLPFALLGLRAWRALFATIGTALGLAALSCLLFSPQLWPAWLGALPVYQGLVGQNPRLFGLMIDLGALPLRLGAPSGMSMALQLGVSAALALGCFFAFRRGDYRLALAALFTGALAAAPHALLYDAPAATLAPLLLWERYGAALKIGDILLNIAVMAAPFLGIPGVVYATASLRLAWLACRRQGRAGTRADPPAH